MDPVENPRLVKQQPAEEPAEPANTMPSDSESPMDEARREKIEKLRKAVADGTYSISAEKVADKLIEHMLEPKE